MEMTTPKAGKPASDSALLRGSGRWSVLWALGMFAIFLGERMIGAGSSRTVATVTGLVLVIGAMAVRFMRAGKAAADRRKLENTLLALYAVGLGAVLLYVIQSDLWASAFKQPLERNWPKLSTVLSALWPVVWVAAAWPILLVELAYAEMARAPRLELGRIRSAVLSGFGLAAALTAAFSFAYVASERDKKLDLAYFRTSRPGEVTRRIVQGARSADRGRRVLPVGERGARRGRRLPRRPGQGIQPAQDHPLRLRHRSGEGEGLRRQHQRHPGVRPRRPRRSSSGLPKDIEGAKTALKTLDKEVQQRLLSIVKPPRMAGFTLGHGERTWERGETDTDKRAGIAMLRDGLIDQTYDVRSVNAADGLMNEVPKGITLLAIIGPRTPFQPEEYASINRFIDGGGRVLIALDPENKVDMHEVLAAAEPRVQGRTARQRSGVRAPDGTEDQRSRQPGDGHVFVAPVGHDAAAPGPARVDRVARRGLDQHQAGSHRGDPGRRADQGALRHLQRQERQLHRTIRARRSAPGSWPPPRSRRTRACS